MRVPATGARRLKSEALSNALILGQHQMDGPRTRRKAAETAAAAAADVSSTIGTAAAVYPVVVISLTP